MAEFVIEKKHSSTSVVGESRVTIKTVNFKDYSRNDNIKTDYFEFEEIEAKW